jgi:hypothetical protein
VAEAKNIPSLCFKPLVLLRVSSRSSGQEDSNIRVSLMTLVNEHEISHEELYGSFDGVLRLSLVAQLKSC